MAKFSLLNLQTVQNANRNIIHNGDFEIAQRGTGLVVGQLSGTVTYRADRWVIAQTTPNAMSTQISSLVPTLLQSSYNSQQSLQAVMSATATTPLTTQVAMIRQRMESYDTAPLYQKKFRVQIWARSSVSGIFPFALYNGTANRSFITNRSLIANTWTAVVINVPADTFNGNFTTGIGFEFIVGLGAGPGTRTATVDQWVAGYFVGSSTSTDLVATASATFNISQAAIFLGEFDSTVLIPFRRNGQSIAQDLQMAQRYCFIQKIPSNSYVASYSANGVFYGQVVALPVEMRVNPTMTYAGITGASYWTQPGINGYSTSTLTGLGLSSSSTTWSMNQSRTAGGATPTSNNIYNWEPTFALTFDAEL